MQRIHNIVIIGVGVWFCLGKQLAAADDAAVIADLIDVRIQQRLNAEGVPGADPADDAQFLRRAFLDLHGVVPATERARRFLDSEDDRKRVALIDELLASPQFGRHIGGLWRNYLISPLAREQRVEADRFGEMLADRINRNDGWDRIAYDLVTASGKIEDNPAVAYLVEGRFPLSVTDLTDLSSRYFLGLRLNCAQCHDHPFVSWKREDYWGMPAFFAEIQTPGRPKMVYRTGIQDDPSLTLATLQTSDAIDGFQAEPPTFLGGERPRDNSDATLRAALATWMTSAENPYFAKAMVNRMWWHFFGRGIVHPVDDMHTENSPSHPELLDELSRRFADANFDLKFLCRAIVMSRTYQQSSRPVGEDVPPGLFASMPIKVLTGEQLYDSLVQILGPPAKSPAIRTGSDARREFSQFFASDGDPEPTRYEHGIPQALRLMNSPQFADRNIRVLVSQTAGSPEDAVVEMFLTILSRRPAAAEREFIEAQLQSDAASQQEMYRALAWSLLMSSEFLLNH